MSNSETTPLTASLPLRALFSLSSTSSGLAGVLLLGARLYAGYTIASAGFDKLPTPSWMVDQVVSLEIFPAPEFFAFTASFGEFLGGVLLGLGLMTRLSAAMLAFTLGVAAFGFQKVTPITGMHIAQHFFWLFVVFVAVGPGCLSLDHLLRSIAAPKGDRGERSGLALLLAAPFVLAPAGYGLYAEYFPPEPTETKASDTSGVTAVSLAGNFNEWDLKATPLRSSGGENGAPPSLWSTEIQIEKPGPIQFKFAANETWDVNLGEADQEAKGCPIEGTGEIGAANIEAYVPEAGTYRFSVDLATYAYRFEKVPASG
ncbi:MAG: DoxX family membrane protein [Planctomycetota bacterium]